MPNIRTIGHQLLIPHARITFRPEGEVDAKRFKQLFRRTWADARMRVRKTLLNYWRAWGNKIYQACPSLEIHFLPIWGIVLTSEPLLFVRDADRFAFAYVTGRHYGNRIVFWGPYLDALPEEHACCIIAHELSHVYLHALPDSTHLTDDEEIRESEADETVEWEWGYDIYGANDWRRAHKAILPDPVLTYDRGVLTLSGEVTPEEQERIYKKHALVGEAMSGYH